jgi:AP-3 complex subunit beta
MIIKQVTKLMDKITTPQARATILWILAEFCHRNERASKYAPDVLRKIAKTFCNESDIVKLQALNLASKLYITNDDSDRLKLLVNFIFNLAKYDLNYDVRDRGRILRQLLNDITLAKRILLTPKCVPNISKAISSGNLDNSRFRIGTLSHFIGKKVSDYEELPDWPEVQPDTSVRAKLESFEEPTFALVNIKETNVRKKKENGFYSSAESDESETDDEQNEDNSEDLSDEESGSLDDESEDEFDDEEEQSDEEEDEEQSSTEASDSESSLEVKPISNPKTKPTISNVKNTELIQRKEKETKTKPIVTKAPAVDFLLDFDDMSSMPSNASLILSPMGSIQTQPTPTPSGPYRIIETAEKIPTTTYELIGVTAKFKIIYRFPRMRDNIQTLVELIINSDCEQSMTISGANSVEFKGSQNKELSLKLSSGEIKLVTLGIDFNESPSQGIDITINDNLKAKIVAPIGEIVIPVRFTDAESFKSEQIKLKGMNEVIEKITLNSVVSDQLISDTVLKVANLGTNMFVEHNILRYSGATLKFKSLVLVTIEKDDNFIKQTVNCEKMIIGSMLSKLLKDSFLKLT